MDWTFWVGNAVTLAISVTGWVITAVSGRRAGKREAEQFNETLRVQKEHVDKLAEQVSLLKSEAGIPRWDVWQLGSRKSVMFAIRNRNPYDAFDVRIEFNEDDAVTIGDVTRGSERSFDFRQMLFMGGVRTDLTVTWLTGPDSDHRHRMTVIPVRSGA